MFCFVDIRGGHSVLSPRLLRIWSIHQCFSHTRSFGVLKKSTKLRSYGSVTNSSFCHTWVNLFLSGAFAIQGVQRAIDENWDAALVQIDPSARCTSCEQKN